jgi:hypothetical protein
VHHHRRRVLASLAAGAALSAAVTGGAAVTAAAADVAVVTVADADELAADQLAADYKLTRGEARARIARQDVDDRVLASVTRTAPSFGGAYVAQETDGALVVQLASPGDAPQVFRAAAANGVAGSVRVEIVRRSERELTTLVNAIYDKIALRPDAAALTMAPNPKSGTVELFVPQDGPAGQAAIVDEVVRAFGSDITVTVVQGAGPVHTACTISTCNPPLRGGIKIGSSAGPSGYRQQCTSGFNLKDAYGNKFLLTAGHCLAGEDPYHIPGSTWVSRMEDNIEHTIGNSYDLVFGRRGDGKYGDLGIITISNSSSTGWNPRNWVFVAPSSGAYPTTLNAQYPITSTATTRPAKDSYVCHTGSKLTSGTGGTACGKITHPTYYWPGPDGYQLDQVRAAMTTCEGDSGGPVYIGNKAHGIVSASESAILAPGANQCYVYAIYNHIAKVPMVWPNLSVMIS